jgi:hypothetical protein
VNAQRRSSNDLSGEGSKRGHSERVELIQLVEVDRHTHAASFRVHAEGTLEQVVLHFGHVRVEAWVAVEEHELHFPNI